MSQPASRYGTARRDAREGADCKSDCQSAPMRTRLAHDSSQSGTPHTRLGDPLAGGDHHRAPSIGQDHAHEDGLPGACPRLAGVARRPRVCGQRCQGLPAGARRRCRPRRGAACPGAPLLPPGAIPPHEWFGSYINTYVERDVRKIQNVSDLGAFQTFLRLCAGRTGQLLNLLDLGSDGGISHNTVAGRDGGHDAQLRGVLAGGLGDQVGLIDAVDRQDQQARRRSGSTRNSCAFCSVAQ